ncbi:small acidic -like [Brachionus plicatilis]|uniref:Small acidic protein n=1 Tax=Brachionus plicatilis TaxID=10195 RepID=A0A3M7SPE3_BRAPC|nr:small acidic -like [Brachionus plicatilis]
MSAKKAEKKSIEDDVEESLPRKKSKKDKEHKKEIEREDEERIKKKAKKEKKKKEKKDKEHSKETEQTESSEVKGEKIVPKEQYLEDDKNKIEAEVHTANNWEEADLGNDQRKLKFLKLMGAFKHKSEKDVPQKHSREKNETQKIAEDLEKQFNEGISHKFKAKNHLGLGFHANEEPAKKLPENKRIVFDD